MKKNHWAQQACFIDPNAYACCTGHDVYSLEFTSTVWLLTVNTYTNV